MPFGYIVNISKGVDDDEQGEGRSITISNDRNVSEQLNDTSNGNVTYKHFVISTRTVPGPGGRPKFIYEPKLIISPRKYNSMREAQDAQGTDADAIVQDMQTLTNYEMTQYSNYTNSITQKKN